MRNFKERIVETRKGEERKAEVKEKRKDADIRENPNWKDDRPRG